MERYEVKKGDTLWSISKKLLGNGERFKEIQKENNMADTVIHPGQVLKIPSSKPTFEDFKKAFEKAAGDIDNLPSVKRLYELIGD